MSSAKEFIDKLDTEHMYYLASPYTHKDPFIQHMRYTVVDYVGSQLCTLGVNLIEPITSCHLKSRIYNLPSGYEFWKKRDRTAIESSEGVIVVTLPGWGGSRGVQDEVHYAEALAKDVHYLDPSVFISKEVWDAIHK